jgi:hypothetical protein
MNNQNNQSQNKIRDTYYMTVFQRRNVLIEAIMEIFFKICSYPKLTLEVFIRQNMGERYINISSVITVAIILLVIPTGISPLLKVLSPYNYGSADSIDWGRFATWYIFVVGFIYYGIKRCREIKKYPGVYDFARFTKSSGWCLLRPLVNSILSSADKPNIRTFETYIEPLIFFVAGLLLWLLGQPLGALIVFCAIVYCIATAGAYRRGDHFIMDKIDEMICNRDLAYTFLQGNDQAESGFKWVGPDIPSKEKKQKVYDSVVDDEDIPFAQ